MPRPSGMPDRRHPLRGFGALLCLLLGALPAAATPTSEQARALWTVDEPVADTTLRLADPRIAPDRIAWRLVGPDERVAATIHLRHPSRHGHPVGDFSVLLRVPQGDLRNPEEREALRAIDALLDRLERADGALVARALSPHEPAQEEFFADLRAHLRAARPLGVLGALWLLALVTVRGPRLQVSWNLKPNHLVPALLQIGIFTYWSMYFHGVAGRVPDILSQIAFAYGFDALLNLSLHRRWRLGIGPVPIVLSTNLFVWYPTPWLQWGVLALALASRVLLRRDGRHLFNPSAFGIAIAALATILLPQWFGWGSPTMDEAFNLPPNMTEFLLLVALIAQSRFPIVLVPMSAVVAFSFLSKGGWAAPLPFWPSTFLILLLFATDPHTIPRTNPGRVLYGVFLAVAITAVSQALTRHGLPDAYAKVIPIPAANLLSPAFDRIGRGLSRGWWAAMSRPHVAHLLLLPASAWLEVLHPALGWLAFTVGLHAAWRLWRDERTHFRPWSQPLHPRYNRWHLLAWIGLTYLGVRGFKADSLPVFEHFNNQTPGLVLADGHFARCDDNPAFCQPFSFLEEVRSRSARDASR